MSLRGAAGGEDDRLPPVLVGIADSLLACAAGSTALLLLHSLWRLFSSLRMPTEGGSNGMLEASSLFLLVVSFLLFRALKLGPASRVNAGLALVSTLAGLYAAEVWLNPWRDPDNVRLQVIAKLRRRGIDAVPAVTPYVFMRGPSLMPGLSYAVTVHGRPTIPLAGIARRVTVDCKEDREWLVYESDEHGFHNPTGIWGGHGIELVAVGDSFTAGSCVPSGENMVARIRLWYPATLNLGMGGNGPLAMLAGMREYVPHLKPAAVLWCYSAGNDLLDLRFEKEHPIIGRYLETGFQQGLFDEQEDIDQALASYVRGPLAKAWLEQSGAVHVIKDTLLLRWVRSKVVRGKEDLEASGRGDPNFDVGDEDYRLFTRVLEEAKRTAAQSGSRIYFVYLPDWGELFGRERSRRLAEGRRRSVLDLVHRLAIPVIDVREAFRAHGRKKLFSCPACHYSAEGYDVAATKVLDALRADEPLRWTGPGSRPPPE